MSIFSPEQVKCLEQILEDSEFANYGFTNLEKPQTFTNYSTWIQNGFHGNMDYMERHMPAKESPQQHFNAQSAIVIGLEYLPHPKPTTGLFENLNVALYARGEDYHHWFRNKLSELAQLFQRQLEDCTFSAHTDSSPLLERDLAYRAGLGWFGKNSCLIHPEHGSLFFIGEILCSHRFQSFAQAPVHDHCGTCTRCIDACPTDAIVDDKQIDARKCISYLTIESKKPAEESLRSDIGDWMFGCDICQTVCPWNTKVFKEELELEQSRATQPEERTLELKEILSSSNKSLLKKIYGTPLTRAGAKGLKKNALITIANLGLKQLSPEVQSYTKHPELGELAHWCLDKLDS